jgi:phosphoglycerate dehydrogenase-like enzyme/predicted dehydrogenase
VATGSLENTLLRALIIGAGPASVDMHLPILARLRDRGELALAIVCDIQQERAAAALKRFRFLEAAGDAQAALERPEIDVVYIFGSAQMHYQYGLAALRNGKHLFVEKPVAPSYTHAVEMAVAARGRGVIAAGGHNRRFYRSLAAVRARAGKAGWRFAEAVFHKAEHAKPPRFGARTWLGANGIHALDALMYMMGGLPDDIASIAEGNAANEPRSFSAIMRWRNGAQGAFLSNNDAGARREEYVFHAAAETCTVTDAGVTVHRDEGKSQILRASPDHSLFRESLAAEHDAFLVAIRGGDPPPHSLAAIAPSLFLGELIETGYRGPVTLPEASRSQPTERAAMPRAGGQRSILLVQPDELQSALGRLLPQYRLVTLEDMARSDKSRPDVTAAILGRGSTALARDILARLPQLRVVGVVGLSLTRFAPETLLERGIELVNASEAYAESVAELALGLAILSRRRAFLSHEVMRRGGWGTDLRQTGLDGMLRRAGRRAGPAINAMGMESIVRRARKMAGPSIEGPATRVTGSHELQGATVALIGWGASARAFSRRLVFANARVVVYSEHATAAEILQAGTSPVSLDEALAADIVSLHRGLTKATRHGLGAPELARLRPGAVLINVARGALIEPRALVARLMQGDIFACLDSYEEEPVPASDPLRRLPNVFLTSHIAGGSADMYAAAAEEVVRKVAMHLAGDGTASISPERLRTKT